MKNNIGIIVSGGPAPGINSVIVSAAFHAEKNNYNLIGFKKGHLGVCLDKDSKVNLKYDEILPFANTGGSIIGTSRFNPFNSKEDTNTYYQKLKENNISKLIVIGGEGSAYLSLKISQEFKDIQVVHIPKTIDNDLILPNKYPSFGYSTSTYVGNNILKTLSTEAKTRDRWFIIRTMGRNAGFLALGFSIVSHANALVIAEEFPQKNITAKEIAEAIFVNVKKRSDKGKAYGVALISEGLIDKLNEDEILELSNCPRDEMGRIKFEDVALEYLVLNQLKILTKNAGLDINFRGHNLGYELRCADPIPFDIEYTKFLGFGAIKFLLEGLTGVMIVRDFEELSYINLKDISDENGVIQSRSVDLNSDMYKIAKEFMTD